MHLCFLSTGEDNSLPCEVLTLWGHSEDQQLETTNSAGTIRRLSSPGLLQATTASLQIPHKLGLVGPNTAKHGQTQVHCCFTARILLTLTELTQGRQLLVLKGELINSQKMLLCVSRDSLDCLLALARTVVKEM